MASLTINNDVKDKFLDFIYSNIYDKINDIKSFNILVNVKHSVQYDIHFSLIMDIFSLPSVVNNIIYDYMTSIELICKQCFNNNRMWLIICTDMNKVLMTFFWLSSYQPTIEHQITYLYTLSDFYIYHSDTLQYDLIDRDTIKYTLSNLMK